MSLQQHDSHFLLAKSLIAPVKPKKGNYTSQANDVVASNTSQSNVVVASSTSIIGRSDASV